MLKKYKFAIAVFPLNRKLNYTMKILFWGNYSLPFYRRALDSTLCKATYFYKLCNIESCTKQQNKLQPTKNTTSCCVLWRFCQ